MTKSKVYLSLILVALILFNIGFFSYSTINLIDDIEVEGSGHWMTTPFTIYQNSDWFSLTVNDWCNGTGTLNNPYRIENLTINGQGSPCITIIDTDVYFRIMNCNFSNSLSYPTLSLESVSNGYIAFNNLSYNGVGIRMQDCRNIAFTHNLIYNSTDESIVLQESQDTYQGCSNNTISYNTCFNNDVGIYVEDSNNNTIKGNQISDNRIGIIISNANNTLIYNNTVNNNQIYGINVHTSINGTVEENKVINNEEVGINLVLSHYSKLKSNFVSKNYGLNDSSFIGIRLTESTFIRISDNVINASDTGIRLIQSTQNTIFDNIIRYLSNCIVEQLSSGNLIYDNNCSQLSLDESGPEPTPKPKSIPGYNITALIGVYCIIGLIILRRRRDNN